MALTKLENPYWDEIVQLGFDEHSGGVNRFSWQGKDGSFISAHAMRMDLERRVKMGLTREQLVKKYAWAIPSKGAIRKMVSFSKNIVEIGAGSGYWASLLKQAGANIIAYDICPPNVRKNQYGHAKVWFPVKEGDALSSRLHPHHTLMLCWPNYNTPFASGALQVYEGNKFIYIGEGGWGCTGDEKFHDLLDEHWDVEVVSIPQWDAIHDVLHLCTRKDTK